MRRGVTPLVAAAVTVVAAAGLWWLMRHDLTLAAYAAGVVVVGLVAAAVVLWRRGHRRTPLALAVVLLVTGVAAGGYAWNLNATLGRLPTMPVPSGWQSGRPAPEPTKALTVLLMGADNPQQLVEKPTVAELMADGTWDVDAYRSDSLMVLRIAADRRSASVVSIPRDSYVPIYDADNTRHGSNKINEAFASYGPYGTVRTVEHLTGLRIDHLAIIDFEGFRDLTTALDGVDVYVPQTVYDSQLDQTWEEGWHHIQGQGALNYVRMRYGLPGSDFDRVARQQNFLRAVLDELTDSGTFGDPLKVRDVLGVVVDYVTVDADWQTGDLRSLALGLRHLTKKDIEFVTMPFDHFENIPGVGDSNILDAARVRELFKAVRAGKVEAYLAKYPDDALAGEKSVS
jgi:LCP family protein required for cell wall assembly